MKGKVLYALLDKHRLARGWSWRQLGREVSIHSSTFTRLRKGRGIGAPNLMVLGYNIPGLLEELNAKRKTR